MQINYTIVHKGKTLFYTTETEAIKMARFIGFPVNQIKTVHVW